MSGSGKDVRTLTLAGGRKLGLRVQGEGNKGSDDNLLTSIHCNAAQ